MPQVNYGLPLTAIGGQPVHDRNPQGHLLSDVKDGSSLGFSVAQLVAGLKQQHLGQKTGRHVAPVISWTPG